MKLAGLTARVTAILVLAICAWQAFGAPLSIGFVAPDEEPRYTNLLQGLRQGLQAAGPAARDAVILEHRIRRGDSAAARGSAESLRAKGARVAFVVGTELTRQLRSVTKELPIVFITPGNPVRPGLAASLARPGNNLTGVTFEFPELSAKRLEMLKEIAPAARRIGVVYDPRDGSPRQGYAAVMDAAPNIGMQLVELDVERLRAGEGAFKQAGKLDGLVLVPGGAISTVFEPVFRFAAAQRIVSIVWARSKATQEAILSYGASDINIAQGAARLVARVLDGHPAGDLPVEQPTKFELVINMKTAKALGITIPQSVLVRADRVIE
ncbi:MAG: ABC transporter substrate-binding protein [Betaproteobacteria bacterium]|nr:ABC transporter substrate-binding protein [Betaproteobacteria bacterium]